MSKSLSEDNAVDLGVGGIIFSFAERQPDAPALHSDDKSPLTYRALDDLVRRTGAHLNAHGVGRGDRVGLVIGDAPRACAAYLATVSSAIAVPLNPRATRCEIRTLVRSLSLDALIVSDDALSLVDPADRAALPIFQLGPEDSGAAGDFVLEGEHPVPAREQGFAVGGELACIMPSSGTTGTPKAVQLTHETLLFRAERDRRCLDLSPGDVTINFRPPHLSGPLNIGLLSSICSGGSVVVPACFDADGFFHALTRHRITWYTGGPAYHRAILERAADHTESLSSHRLRFVRSAGYALPQSLQANLESLFGVPCIQKYGSSEAGLVSCTPLPPGIRKPGYSGPPVDCEVRIVTADGKDAPTSEDGEILVRGPGVFRRYDSAEMTAGAFVDGWFRTGDMGVLDSEGYLAVTGRLNEVINRGGQKISPWEVEEVFSALPGVADALCFPVPHPTLSSTAGLAVVPKTGCTLDADRLRQQAAPHLSRFKLPETIILTDRLPIGPAGKPQRRSAAATLGLGVRAMETSTPPRIPEDRLEEIWCEVLKIEGVSDDQNFTLAGGDSLRATALVIRIQETFGRSLSPEIVYGEGATLAGLRAVLEKTAAETGPTLRRSPRARPDPSAPLPLTNNQERVWSVCTTYPDMALYNTCFGLRFDGSPDFDALRDAVNLLVARHEALRAIFAQDAGRPFQRFLRHLDVPLEVTDLRSIPVGEREERLRIVGHAKAHRGYDLACGPLVRADAIRIADDQTVVLFQSHHIIGDANTTGILSRELTDAYDALRNGRSPNFPLLHWTFGEFVTDQAARLTKAHVEELVAYWASEIDGAPTRLDLPADRRRPDIMSHRGQRISLKIPEDTVAAMRLAAARWGVSLFSLAFAAFEILLARHTDLKDFLIGTAVDTRPPGTANSIVGFGLNTVPMRARIDETADVRSYTIAVHAKVVAAREHKEVPFDELVKRFAAGERGSTSPLIQVVFGIMPRGTRPEDLDNAERRFWNLDHDRARFELTVMLDERPDGLGGFAEFATDLFDVDTISLMMDRYSHLLGEIVRDPDAPVGSLSAVPDAEAAQLDRFSRGPETAYPADSTVHAIFKDIVRARPDGIAVERGKRRLTYAELDTWSDAVATMLQGLGAGEGAIVALTAERSPDAIAGLLGILKAGAAYLTLEPDLPALRVRQLLDEANPAAILVQPGSRSLAAEEQIALALPPRTAGSGRPLSGRAAPDSLAYLCFTSGSTGRPKAVEIEHRAVLRLVKGQTYAALGSDERIAQTGSLGFDASTFEIWGALLNGGTLVQPAEDTPSIADYAALLTESGVTTVWFTAGLFRQMVDLRPDSFRSTRQVLTGGDVVSVDHVRTLLTEAPDCAVINGYGPTENTTFSVCGMLDLQTISGGLAPIGFPIANSTAYVLDDRLRPVPIGVEGDLYVGGAGVARGYRNRPDLTREVFIPDPFIPDGRMYRTGDRARFRRDGRIEFLGRRDSQVKIRGFRVELEEIEAALREAPGVADAVVLDVRENGTVSRLEAFVTENQTCGGADKGAEQISFLKARLPAYMVPARCTVMKRFPLNRSGKIDRKAISVVGVPWAGSTNTTGTVPPRTPVERLLASIWTDLLGHGSFGIDDDFFLVGGHSLLVMQLAFRIEEETGVELPQIDFFAHSTIREMGEIIFERLASEEDAPDMAGESDGTA